MFQQRSTQLKTSETYTVSLLYAHDGKIIVRVIGVKGRAIQQFIWQDCVVIINVQKTAMSEHGVISRTVPIFGASERRARWSKHNQLVFHASVCPAPSGHTPSDFLLGFNNSPTQVTSSVSARKSIQKLGNTIHIL